MPNGKPTAMTRSPGARSFGAAHRGGVAGRRGSCAARLSTARSCSRHARLAMLGVGLEPVGMKVTLERARRPIHHVQVGQDRAVVDDHHAGAHAALLEPGQLARSPGSSRAGAVRLGTFAPRLACSPCGVRAFAAANSRPRLTTEGMHLVVGLERGRRGQRLVSSIERVQHQRDRSASEGQRFGARRRAGAPQQGQRRTISSRAEQPRACARAARPATKDAPQRPRGTGSGQPGPAQAACGGGASGAARPPARTAVQRGALLHRLTPARRPRDGMRCYGSTSGRLASRCRHVAGQCHR